MSREVLVSTLLHRVIDSTYSALVGIAENLGDKSDAEKKRMLYNFFESSRQQFVRVLVLARWARGVTSVTRAQEIAAMINVQDRFLTETADKLFNTSQRLQNARSPRYDVESAIEILTTGTYSRLPVSIALAAPPKPPSDSESAAVLAQIDRAIRCRVFTTPIPGDFTGIRMGNGQLVLRVDGEFEASVTVDGPGAGDPWRLLWIDILVPGVPASTRRRPGDSLWLVRFRDWIAAMLGKHSSSDPMMFLYRSLHFFCLDLRVKCVKAEAQQLQSSRRPGSVVFRKEKHPPKTWSLYYWCQQQQQKPVAADRPHLLFSVDEWGQLQLRHAPPLIDPATGKAATFSLSGTTRLADELDRAMYLGSISTLESIRTAIAAKAIAPYQPPSAHVPTLYHFANGEPYLDLPLFGDCWAHFYIDRGTGEVLFESSFSVAQDMMDRLKRTPALAGDLITNVLYRSAQETVMRLCEISQVSAGKTDSMVTVRFPWPLFSQFSPSIWLDEQFAPSITLQTPGGQQQRTAQFSREPFFLSFADSAQSSFDSFAPVYKSLRLTLCRMFLLKQLQRPQDKGSSFTAGILKGELTVDDDLRWSVILRKKDDAEIQESDTKTPAIRDIAQLLSRLTDHRSETACGEIIARPPAAIEIRYGRVAADSIQHIMYDLASLSFIDSVHADAGLATNRSLLSIEFNAPSVPTVSVHVSCRTDIRVGFAPPMPWLSAALDAACNTRRELRLPVRTAAELHGFLRASVGVSSCIANFTSAKNSSVMPNDFSVVYRRPDVVRLVFRAYSAIELVCRESEFVVYDPLDVVHKTPPRLARLTVPPYAVLGHPEKVKAVARPISELPAALAALHRVMAQDYLCYRMPGLVAAELASAVVPAADGSFSFTVGTSRRTLNPRAASPLFDISEPSLQALDLVNRALTKILSGLVLGKEPWRIQAATSFARIALLPTAVLMEFAHTILAMEASVDPPCGIVLDPFVLPVEMQRTFATGTVVRMSESFQFVAEFGSKQKRFVAFEYSFSGQALTVAGFPPLALAIQSLVKTVQADGTAVLVRTFAMIPGNADIRQALNQ